MIAILILALIPLALCSGEGNIRLLEDDIAVALKACTVDNGNAKGIKERQKRSEDSYNQSPRIDDGSKQINKYGHERRNSSEQTQVFNATQFDAGVEAVTIETWEAKNDENVNRTKRNEPLFNKPDTDQCLSQCVFANLQVVDTRGIPREAELWNKVQDSVASQQSRAALHDQIRACFQELQSEAEDDGCSYSNKLERCLMLRFSDRKTGATQNKQSKIQEKQKTAA